MNLGKLFAGWGFRTRRPQYEAGEVLVAYVTGHGPDGARVRIGDTVITLPDGDPSLIERRVRFEITSFDPETSNGSAELLETLD
jgi:hypothetical protein